MLIDQYQATSEVQIPPKKRFVDFAKFNLNLFYMMVHLKIKKIILFFRNSQVYEQIVFNRIIF